MFPFCKGPRNTSLAQIITQRYTANVIELLSTDVEIARTLVVSLLSFVYSA